MKFSKYIYAEEFEGAAKETNFKVVEEEIDENLKDNEFLYEALYVSCDPYVRLICQTFVVGETVIPGYQICKVIKSNNPKYPVEHILVLASGWRNGGKSDGSDVLYVRNDVPKNVSLSAAFGIFGMTGLTGYYGVHHVLKPKAGETLVVSGAAGAVGTVVGQIGKILGCRVIGACGSEEKVKFLKSVGYNDAFNYKKETVPEALTRLAPNGVDCYFDNVGGDFSTYVLEKMNKKGRVAVCGSMSTYDAKERPKAYVVQSIMPLKSILMQGFNIFDDIPPYADEIYAAMKKWAEEGKLKQYEYVTEGFKSLPCAFIGMMCGKNIGKTVAHISYRTVLTILHANFGIIKIHDTT